MADDFDFSGETPHEIPDGAYMATLTKVRKYEAKDPGKSSLTKDGRPMIFLDFTTGDPDDPDNEGGKGKEATRLFMPTPRSNSKFRLFSLEVKELFAAFDCPAPKLQNTADAEEWLGALNPLVGCQGKIYCKNAVGADGKERCNVSFRPPKHNPAVPTGGDE